MVVNLVHKHFGPQVILPPASQVTYLGMSRCVPGGCLHTAPSPACIPMECWTHFAVLCGVFLPLAQPPFGVGCLCLLHAGFFPTWGFICLAEDLSKEVKQRGRQVSCATPGHVCLCMWGCVLCMAPVLDMNPQVHAAPAASHLQGSSSKPSLSSPHHTPPGRGKKPPHRCTLPWFPCVSCPSLPGTRTAPEHPPARSIPSAGPPTGAGGSPAAGGSLLIPDSLPGPVSHRVPQQLHLHPRRGRCQRCPGGHGEGAEQTAAHRRQQRNRIQPCRSRPPLFIARPRH